MHTSAGLHHITAICADPKRNVAFYTRDLGLRLVKKTVNFDDPGTWHLYYGDETGSPGSALTFFAWAQLPRGRNGPGMAVEIAFAVPAGSLAYWHRRLTDHGIAHDATEQRFGEQVLPLRDPDGLRLELVESPAVDRLGGRSGGDVPAAHAVRGFHGVTVWVGDSEATGEVLTGGFGFSPHGRQGNARRFTTGSALGGVVDLRAAAGFPAGRQGTGSVHHVAFRAVDDAAQADMAAAVRRKGLHPTEQIDRQYFRSIYFREPSGVLFEIATDGPGFTVDEPPDKLGSAIKLPPRYETERAKIEAALPPLG